MSELGLITFPPSLDSEFSRFVLAHYKVPHHEMRHTLIFSSCATLIHGRTILFPLVYGPGVALNNVKDIVQYFEGHCVPELRLLPPGVSSGERKRDWTMIRNDLGNATVVLAYYHIVPQREVLISALSEGVPDVEAMVVERAYPFFAGILRTLLRLTAARERAARVKILQVMQTIDERLADGRPYLEGSSFTLTDLAFAVAAAPVVWPPEYGGAFPDFDETPAPLRAFIEETRKRPAGKFALRLWHDHRSGT